MKVLAALPALLIILFGVSGYGQSPKKPVTAITGKWKLAAVYQGYHNGGDFKWKPAPVGNRYISEFRRNGSFNYNGVSAACLPATFIKKDSLLIITYKCNKTDTSYIEKLSRDTLIIRNKVMEGITKSKFFRVK
jgi:hypothetical protein